VQKGLEIWQRRLNPRTVVWLASIILLAIPAASRAAGSAYVANAVDSTASQFAIGTAGELVPLSPATVATGASPVGIALSPDDTSAYVTNSGDGTVSQYDVDPTTGALSPKTPATVAGISSPIHTGIAVTPNGRTAYVTNFNDNTVSQYGIDPTTGALSPKTPLTVATGKGPLGIAVTPDGNSAYVAGTTDGTVSQYDIDPLTGALTPKTPASAPAGTAPSGVAVSPDGKSAYVHDAGSVSQFDINSVTGALTPKSPASVIAGTGSGGSGTDDSTPIAVSPDGKSVYDVSGSSEFPEILQYDVDPVSGKLTAKTPGSVATDSQPDNLAVSSDGKSVYATDLASAKVSQYDVDATNGTLSPKTPATATTGSSPTGIAVSPVPLTRQTTTTISCSPATVVAGNQTSCTATVSDTTTPHGTVGFTSSGPGSFSGAGSCTLAETSIGVASCSVAYTPDPTPNDPQRTDTVTGSYGGDGSHTASHGSTEVTVISPTLLARGSFVIGDQSAIVGDAVTFWGAQWSAANGLSGGPAPASFKGFASQVPHNPPACNDRWTTDPGNRSRPPAGVPTYMDVIVSGTITKSGSRISGDTEAVVVVRTDPGYDGDPGHPGTGTVVAQVC
jgi:6-phosphogluconolactonase (cycloisomerase 2 family)